MKRILVVVLAAACDPAPVSMAQWPCPTAGTSATYTSFGAAFLDENCNSCHSADAGGRHGAPTTIRFDTLDDVHQHASRIFERAAGPNDTMPPGPDVKPPVDQRDQLADWLACGAP